MALSRLGSAMTDILLTDKSRLAAKLDDGPKAIRTWQQSVKMVQLPLS